jgi:lipopolysaccharide export system protein LptA
MSSDVCGDWQATSPDSWITFPSGSSGSGNGTVTYSIGVNSGASRQGTMTINGETYTVNQAATSGNNPYKIGGSTHGYSTIQDAYNALAEGNTLKIQALEFTGGLLLAQEKTVTLQGGFNCDFTSNLGYTTISDKMTVKHGTVIIERLIIK